ncbi:MAG: thioredoxin family protein [Gammaproteobacteria bacterium]|nr:thioredoxin family protein [Gammaproteobacteria bacterium]
MPHTVEKFHLPSLALMSLLLFAATAAAERASNTATQGNITATELLEAHATFRSGFSAYQPATAELESLASIQQPITLWIVFGTWCHDSEREVPIVLKLLSAAANPNITVHLVSVEQDKQIPPALGVPFTIEYTPTLVLLDAQGKTMARWVEHPDSDWATDISQALIASE